MKRAIAALLFVVVGLSAFAGTCTLRNVKITVIADHDTYGAEMFNDSGAQILQHKFVVAFIGPNNNLVESKAVDGCLRSLQIGASDFFSATANADSDDTTTALSRLALDSTLKYGEVASGDAEISGISVSRSAGILTVTGTITNRDSAQLRDVAVCAVVRDIDDNVIVVQKDVSVGDGDLDDNEAGTFSITITVPEDGNIVDTVDIWMDGLDANEDERPIGPRSSLNNVVGEHGSANRLAFTTQPSGTATGGASFGTQPVVEIRDSNNNRVGNSSATVTLQLTAANGATLNCAEGGNSPSKAAVNGVAAFSGCDINLAGTYSITAKSSGLTDAVSTNVVVSVGPAAQLAFSPQPSSTGTGVLSTQPTVFVQDAGGNTVTGYTTPVTLALQSGSGTLSGCSSTTIGGVAAFSGCSIDTTGAKTIRASSGGLPVRDSASFTISP